MPIDRGAAALLLALMLSACTDAPLPGTPAMLRIGFGTGFFVANGVVATAAHVVKDCRRIDIWSGDVPQVQAAVLRSSRAQDVALLRVPVAAPAALAPAQSPARAETLRAFGYAGASEAARPLEATPRLVNAQARADTPADPGEILWLQDAAIGHGWSGGPVLDADGRVAGIIIAVMPDAASAGAVLDAPLEGVAIATGLDGLHLPEGATSATGDAARAVVHVRCVE